LPVVKFEREGKAIEVEKGANLRKVALKSGINVYKGIDSIFNCRGHGLCGTCRVEIVDGEKNVSRRTPLEEWTLRGKFLIARKINPNLRLSCKTIINGDITVLTSPKVEIDREETKERIKLFILFSGFGIMFLIAILLIVFNYIGKFPF
jgi:ferredoxin